MTPATKRTTGQSSTVLRRVWVTAALVACAWIWAAPVHAAVTFVQKCDDQQNSANGTCVFGSDVTSGNVIVGMAGGNGNQNTLTGAITDSLGSTYTTLRTISHASSNTTGALFCTVLGSTGANTITAPWTNSMTGNTTVAVEVSGVNTTGGCAGAMVEDHDGQTDGGTGCVTGTDNAVTPVMSVTAGNFGFGAIFAISNGSATEGTGWTMRATQTPSSAFVYGYGETRDWASTGSTPAVFTASDPDTCVIGGLSLVAAAAGGGGGMTPSSRLLRGVGR